MNSRLPPFAAARPCGLLLGGSLLLPLLLAFPGAAPAQPALGATALWEGPGAGSDSVVLAATGAWTATPNASWLHLSAPYQNGAGSTNVVFAYDANAGPTRTGTLSVATQTLTVIQAGSTYAAAPGPMTTLVASGLYKPYGLGVDGAGNVYIADTFNNAVREWSVASNTVATLISSGLNHPYGLAVDSNGNVYFADCFFQAIKEWSAANHAVTKLVASGLSYPEGVALDREGNVYFADTDNNAIKEWVAASNTVVTLVGSGLSFPDGVGVDAAGNVYFADTGNNAIKEWVAASNTVITLVGSGLSSPFGVAVDGGGNVYIADYVDGVVKEWVAASNTVATLVASSRLLPAGVAVDGAGNVYIADWASNSVRELPRAFVDATGKGETAAVGSDVLPVVLPPTANLLAPFAPTSDQPWLSVTGVTNGVVSFAFSANNGFARRAHVNLLGQSIPITQLGSSSFALGTTACFEGPGAGSDSVVLLAVSPPNVGWTATPNAPWLHVSPATQSGLASTNVVFAYDANPGPTRTGTLSIATQTLTVIQAGSTYVAAPGLLTTLAASGLTFPLGMDPLGVAVDGAGNVYIADEANSAIKEWVAASNTVTTLVASGLYHPCGVAVDGGGNVYIADYGDNAIKEWVAASNTVTTLVGSPTVANPEGVAVDGAGNVYIADQGHNAIKVWVAENNTVTTLISSGLSSPSGVAVDAAGNVYIADYGNNAIKEWAAANQTVTTLVSSGSYRPVGVAVDGAGNVYFAETQSIAIQEWVAASNTVTTLAAWVWSGGGGAAVDRMGNVYICMSTSFTNLVGELPRAFVDPTPRPESPAAGSDVLPPVLPPTMNLLLPFAPASDQAWLTITGATNGLVSLAFGAYAGVLNRTAHVTLFGLSIPITQSGCAYSLGATALLEGPAAGVDSVVLAAAVPTAAWTAAANAPWLHLSAAHQSGAGSTNVVFSFDANPGPTRTGTLTIAGLTLTVTQAGATYIAAPAPLTTLTSSNLNWPVGVAVDGAGNVYIADQFPGMVEEWVAASNTVTILFLFSPYSPTSVAVDAAGDVYFSNGDDAAFTAANTVMEWAAASGTLTTLVGSGLNNPCAVAVDGAGNVYIADTYNNAIKEWVAASRTLTTLVASGLSFSTGLAVDAAGNVYIADTGNNVIKEWLAASGTVTTLVASGLNSVEGLAVDGSGNVYFANFGASEVSEWVAAIQTVTNLVASGLCVPAGVAVDGAGNVYIADWCHRAAKELPRAFLDPTPRLEGPLAGSDVLPAVLPTTTNLRAPFAPSSDQPWLTITSATNGLVSFAFTANSGPTRTAHITVLGEPIAITQAAGLAQPTLIGPTLTPNGLLQFAFGSTSPGASFTVLTTTNLALPLANWTVAGAPTNIAPGLFQFTAPLTNALQQFFCVRSP